MVKETNKQEFEESNFAFNIERESGSIVAHVEMEVVKGGKKIKC